MASHQKAAKLVAELRAAVDKNDQPACKRLLSSIKLELTRLPALPPTLAPAPDAAAALAVGREALELGCLAAVDAGDEPAFERTYAQLRPYYADAPAAAPSLPPSPREGLVASLALLRLLVGGRAAEFHAELERLACMAPPRAAGSPEVAAVVRLEAWLAEGSYARAAAAAADAPSRQHAALLARLGGAVADEIAACAEAAHAPAPAADAAALLRLPGGAAELQALAARRGWDVAADGTVTFGKGAGAGGGEAAAPAALPSAELLGNCLTYVRELERIV